ncbi:N-6 DNA methylase [Pseudonocardia aurantiaca]|uniref:N-6 DNA methylase n=1 Tax=Pseudonocardia aurantiaca TaxID=75290 RepID=A0ABW4FPL3_9PSEU
MKAAGAGSSFDVVLANPPFGMSVPTVDLRRDDWRWNYGPPPDDNADFAWL